MTAEEFKKARAELGLTQAELAELLPTSIRTLQKWEQGCHPVNRMAAKQLRQMVDAVRAVEGVTK